MAELQLRHIEPLVAMLHEEFYLSRPAVEEAVRDQRSFNLIHLATMFKVDPFVAKNRSFDQDPLDRATPQLVANDPDRYAIVAGAEDTILARLEWYRNGGEVSERQWRNVLGVVKIQGKRLDWAYLLRQSGSLGVGDLLQRLRD